MQNYNEVINNDSRLLHMFYIYSPMLIMESAEWQNSSKHLDNSHSASNGYMGTLLSLYYIISYYSYMLYIIVIQQITKLSLGHITVFESQVFDHFFGSARKKKEKNSIYQNWSK